MVHCNFTLFLYVLMTECECGYLQLTYWNRWNTWHQQWKAACGDSTDFGHVSQPDPDRSPYGHAMNIHLNDRT